jgi:hypothetical protein
MPPLLPHTTPLGAAEIVDEKGTVLIKSPAGTLALSKARRRLFTGSGDSNQRVAARP